MILQDNRSFVLTLCCLCFIYLGFQLFYTYYIALGVDEFWFAHWIYEYKNGLPYRDFSPYKTVLGYYFLLPSMTMTHGVLEPLFDTKNTLAILNTLLFFTSAIWLKRYFSTVAVISGLILVMYAEFVLSNSTNIRVDLLAYWFCLFSVLCLLENKFILAGILIALGFLTSQKVLWYIVASNFALGCYWLCYARNKKFLMGIILFNVSLLITVGIYITFWSFFSDIKTVLHNIFYDAYIMYQLDVYDTTRKPLWSFIITHNPGLFLLWPFTFLSLLVVPKNDPDYQKRFFITLYSSIILLCLIPYKQVFPYYMLTTIPAFLLLYTAFFSWLYTIFLEKKSIKILFIGKEGVWGLIFLYLITLFYFRTQIDFPATYLLIAAVPILFGIYISPLCKKFHSVIPTLILLTMLFIGIIYPLALFTSRLPNENGHYQKSVLYLMDALLKDNSDYLAGIELVYNKNQPIQGLRHLDAPGVKFLYTPTEKLRPAMLASLYHSPDATVKKIIADLKQSHIKFYINNYRMIWLPIAIKKYLATQYTHFWGSIYLYAPEITTKQFTIKFSGQYQLKSAAATYIDNKLVMPNGTIKLTSGEHHSSTAIFRLKLIPEKMSLLLDTRYREDNWEAML